MQNFQALAFTTKELLRLKVKVAPYIAHRGSRIAHRASRIAHRGSRIARSEILTYRRSLRSLKMFLKSRAEIIIKNQINYHPTYTTAQAKEGPQTNETKIDIKMANKNGLDIFIM